MFYLPSSYRVQELHVGLLSQLVKVHRVHRVGRSEPVE